VILGAGNDTRLHRLTGLPDKLFEIDAPGTQAYKLMHLKIRNPKAKFLAVNFVSESWMEKLIREGFDKTLKTLFIWEGVVYYLPTEVITATLKEISSCRSGSELIFDYLGVEKPGLALAAWLWTVGSLGEPIQTTFTDDVIIDLLREYGLTTAGPPTPCAEAIKLGLSPRLARMASSTLFPFSVKLVRATVR
jgi:methyltransferase (TIGR00027 family)